MSNFKSLGRGVAWGSINALSLIVSKILRGALIPKLLDPANYGLFTSIGIFTRYLQFSDFGTGAWFVKEFPHCHFQKGAVEQQALLDTAFTLIVLSFAVTISYLAGAAAIYHGDAADFYVPALLLLIPITILSKIREFFVSYSIAIQDYGKGTRALIANNYTSLLLVVGGVWYFGAIGGIMAMLLSEVSVALYVLAAVRPKVSFVWGRDTFRAWKQIAQQFMVSITDVVAATVDQIVILRAFDAAVLGFYSLGMTFAWVFEAISEVFNTASYPKLMATARTDRTQAIGLLDQTIFCFLLSTLVALPVALIGMEVLVSYYFTTYRGGLAVYSIILVLGILRGVSSVIRRGYIAFDMEKTYVKYTAVTTAIYAAVMIAAIWLHLSFDRLVGTIVVLNLSGTMILYCLLVGRISAAVVRNVALVVVPFIVLGVYQYGIRSQQAMVGVTGAFAFAVAMLVISSGYVYRKRTVFLDYIR